jgi:hypothetical protein
VARPSVNEKKRCEIYYRIDIQEILHTRRVMLVFDFLGKIGGLSKILWQLGGMLVGFFLKDRLIVEILETLY